MSRTVRRAAALALSAFSLAAALTPVAVTAVREPAAPAPVVVPVPVVEASTVTYVHTTSPRRHAAGQVSTAGHHAARLANLLAGNRAEGDPGFDCRVHGNRDCGQRYTPMSAA